MIYRVIFAEGNFQLVIGTYTSCLLNYPVSMSNKRRKATSSDFSTLFRLSTIHSRRVAPAIFLSFSPRTLHTLWAIQDK